MEEDNLLKQSIKDVGKARPDIIQQIAKMNHKVRVEQRKEILQPTKVNLYGLDIRFKYTEQLLQKEKDKRKLTSISKGKGSERIEVNVNRHALPDEVKQIVSPRKIIPMSRRDSFTLLKRQLEKQQNPYSKKAKTQIQSPAAEMVKDENGVGISLDDTDEWINNYYSGLTLLDEQLKNKLQMVRQKGYQADTGNKSLLGSPRKNQQNTQKSIIESSGAIGFKSQRASVQMGNKTPIHSLDPNVVDSFSQLFGMQKIENFQEMGEKYIQDIREQTKRLEKEQMIKKQLLIETNIDQNLKGSNIMKMTPAQKQEFLLQRKLIQKREKEKQDMPLQSLILDQKQSVCSAWLNHSSKIASLSKSVQSGSPVNILSVSTALSSTHHKNGNTDICLGLAKETQAYTQVFKQTFQDYRKLNKLYENEKLKEKLKDRGSLYGVPSTMYSNEKEIQELIQKMPPMITKPNSLLNGGEIDKKYQIFQEKTKQIYDEADEDLYGDSSYQASKRANNFDLNRGKHESLNQSVNNSTDLPNLTQKNNSTQDHLQENSQQYSTSKPYAHILKVHQNYQLTVGKPKKQLVTSLDMKEKETLKACILEETERYKKLIEGKFHDKFNWSIMMDPKATKAKNEIIRGVKTFQMKQRNLPNFIRKKREEILNQRSQSTDARLLEKEVNQPTNQTQFPKQSYLQNQNQIPGSQNNNYDYQIDSQTQIQLAQNKHPSLLLSQQLQKKQSEIQNDSKLKEDFVDYVKEVLTKTSGMATHHSSTSGKKKLQKVTQKSLTEDIQQFLKDGLENKKQALNSVTIPDILRTQGRKDGVGSNSGINRSAIGSLSKQIIIQ
eukprot:403367545